MPGPGITASDLPLLGLAAAGGQAHSMLLTMSTAIASGVMLIVIARRLNLPAIVLLLVGGVVLGPAVLGDHALVRPDALGGGLSVIVSLAVGLILFEGGLTLDLQDYRSAGAMIRRLLSLGVLITWFGVALAIWFIVRIDLAVALLAASLVIVTGPTVIAPLLKRIQIRSKLHSILHWEGVLIDPIGVFVALLCFEYVVGAESGMGAVSNLGIRVLAGLGLGAGGGLLIAWVVRRRVIPEDMLNVFALAAAVLIFGLAEAVRPEAGLLAVTVAGFLFGITGSYRVKQVREFKAEITDLLIGTLFILLSSRLTFDQFKSFGFEGLLVVAVVLFLIRPLSVAVCAFGLDMTWRERTFLGWVAPRGIVAASMASLFAISMSSNGSEEVVATAQFIETFVYSVIISTIVLQGLTAGPLASLLDLRRPAPNGWLIIGAHGLGRKVASFIAETADVPVLMADTNVRAVREAQADSLLAVNADARDERFADRDEMRGVGHLLAITDNDDLNIRLCQTWSKVFGSERVFRWGGGSEDPDHEEASGTPGRPIWTRLAKLTLVSAELQRGQATLLRAAGHVPAYAQIAVPIVSHLETGIAFDVDEPPEGAATLYLRRSVDYLRHAVRPELIVTIDHAPSLRALFEQLIDAVVQVVPTVGRDETVEELLEREGAFPTALGSGIAAPHAYCGSIDARICVIARVPGGVDFRAHDGEPVTLVFLLLSPPGDPEGHLATLAEIAKRVVEESGRDRLKRARTPAEMLLALSDVSD